MDYMVEYKRWLKNVTESDLLEELKNMIDAAVKDVFYCDLGFGTGGQRGIIRVGTNRMNVHVVVKVSQGLSLYLLEKEEAQNTVIGYDSRIKSDVLLRLPLVCLQRMVFMFISDRNCSRFLR